MNSNYNNLVKYKNICAIGGGTGLGRLLSSLAAIKVNTTGIVATTDTGGSTGWIREQTNSIAWGDIRNCLNQMSGKDCIQGALFQYRFAEFKALENQNLGNLMLYALNQLSGRPLDAITHAREILKINTQLIPMSEQPVHLAAHDAEEVTQFGELAVEELKSLPDKIWLDPDPVATPEAVSAIQQADLIILSAGSLVTSLMPNLLVTKLFEAIVSSNAPVIYIANMLPIDDAIGALTLAQQCRWMEQILGKNIIDAIIWPRSRGRPDCDWITTLVTDVADQNAPLRHDKVKLIAAIDRVLGRLNGKRL
ncbi:MAG: uridine diphosphate-N-acetylglucosamine-binding protein YvcK [Gammaproteobacteria bacterium]|nr:uridine diphosphate-N-acetylglucosamine-binding protein YvcK [Gammaproteobacteria bacterium]MBL6999204.1 uridine diphosphate-N-acetylglucosamine-binding protein YvcK [Gammaproteobacteria bacterium]